MQTDNVAPQPSTQSSRTPVLFCWSGGKDSALALHALRQRADVRVTGLLTTVTDGYDRISMHGVRRGLLLEQARALGLPLHEVRIPPECVNPIYESRMEQALQTQLAAGVRTVAFGDIFLQDLREYRERNLARLDLQAIFPIWKRDTRELAREFCNLGFRAIAVCIDPQKLDRSFAGRELTPQFFADFPQALTRVAKTANSIPSFSPGQFLQGHRIVVEPGEVVNRDGFTFCDLKEQAQ